MQVSFIVPLFNCLAHTQAMVASLSTSLPSGLTSEIILVDDGSTDGTREWLAGLTPPWRVVLNSRNLGYAGANNRGAALAQGDFLALLNNDLILRPGWLEPMLAAARKLKERAGLIGNVQLNARTGEVDHAGLFINAKGKPEHLRRRGFGRLRRAAAVTGACCLLPRSLWVELGGFDEGYVNGCEDVDLAFRAEAAGRVNAVALQSVVRHHVSSSPGRKLRDEANTFRLTQRWHDHLVTLGQRDWCRAYFEAYLPEPRDFPDPMLARAIALYQWGLKRSPPRRAAEGVRAALATELKRWHAIFQIHG
jgi:GT2 family glycosyltransferase